MLQLISLETDDKQTQQIYSANELHKARNDDAIEELQSFLTDSLKYFLHLFHHKNHRNKFSTS